LKKKIKTRGILLRDRSRERENRKRGGKVLLGVRREKADSPITGLIRIFEKKLKEPNCVNSRSQGGEVVI